MSYLLQLGCLFGKQRVIEVCRDCFEYDLRLPAALKEVAFDELVVRYNLKYFRNEYD